MNESVHVGDVVQRAKAALEGIYFAPWIQVGFGNIQAEPVGSHPPVAKTWNRASGDFIVAARSLVPELIAEIERLRGLGLSGQVPTREAEKVGEV